MDLKRIFIIIAVLFVLLLVAVILMNPVRGCYKITDCEECWSWIPQTRACGVNSTEICETDPALEQHNALVDILLCACVRAEQKGFSDTSLNAKIENLYPDIMHNYTGTAFDICNQPSSTAPISKWSYE